jgi:hypothetical protein
MRAGARGAPMRACCYADSGAASGDQRRVGYCAAVLGTFEAAA